MDDLGNLGDPSLLGDEDEGSGGPSGGDESSHWLVPYLWLVLLLAFALYLLLRVRYLLSCSRWRPGRGLRLSRASVVEMVGQSSSSARSTGGRSVSTVPSATTTAVTAATAAASGATLGGATVASTDTLRQRRLERLALTSSTGDATLLAAASSSSSSASPSSSAPSSSSPAAAAPSSSSAAMVPSPPSSTAAATSAVNVAEAEAMRARRVERLTASSNATLTAAPASSPSSSSPSPSSPATSLSTSTTSPIVPSKAVKAQVTWGRITAPTGAAESDSHMLSLILLARARLDTGEIATSPRKHENTIYWNLSWARVEDPKLLSAEDIDSALMELTEHVADLAVSRAPISLPALKLLYLAQCWQRLQAGKARLTAPVAQHVERSVLSYAVLALSEGVAPLAELLVSDTPAARAVVAHKEALVDSGFVGALVAAPDAESTPLQHAALVLVTLLERLVQSEAKAVQELGPYHAYLDLLVALLSLKEVASVVPLVFAVDGPSSRLKWRLPALGGAADVARGARVELMTLLGPFFSPSPLTSHAALKHYFVSVEDEMRNVSLGEFRVTAKEQRECHISVRATREAHVRLLERLLRSLLRPSCPELRAATLEWLCDVLEANRARNQLGQRTDREQRARCSSDGFMLNLAHALLRLLKPHELLAQRDLLAVLQVYGPREISWREFTRLSPPALEASEAAAAAAVEGESVVSSPMPNTLLWLTLLCVHEGVATTVELFDNLNEHLSRSVHFLRDSAAAGPLNALPDRERMSALGEHQRTALLLRQVILMEAVLLDDSLVRDILALYALVAHWLVPTFDLAAANNHAALTALAALPEFILEDMAFLLLFVVRAQRRDPGRLTKNPYVRAKFVEVLYYLADADAESAAVTASASGRADPLAGNAALVAALVQLYHDIEVTGRHNQFVEKFAVRRQIAALFRVLRGKAVYRTAFTALATEQRPLMVQFSSHVVTDAIYLLDHLLEKIAEIRTYEQLVVRVDEYRSLPVNERMEREQTHRQNEGMAQHYATLGTETLHLLLFMSETSFDIFTEATMLPQLAELLNFFLDLLVGPKSKQLLVSDQDKYKFRPRELVTVLVQIYVNFHKNIPSAFAEQIIRDERSYRPETFELALKAVDHTAHHGAFARFIADLRRTAVETPIDESDAPEEFCDELMGTVMSDPVRLPSGQVLDRDTMTRQFLANGNKNPYTNQPMMPEDLQALDDLKAKIAAWRQDKRAKKGGD